jgi:hypothetical protein
MNGGIRSLVRRHRTPRQGRLPGESALLKEGNNDS